MLFKKNNYKYKQKQTYSLFLLIIPLNVKREVNEELTTAFLFVQFLAMSLCATLGLLTQTYVRTHTTFDACVQQVVCCTLSIRMERGYRVLRRTHMLGLRVATKPCLQKHLYEPVVFTQREFLHGLARGPGSAHSSMSGRNTHKHPPMSFRKLEIK